MSSDSNVDYDRIAREIIEAVIATDDAEDEQRGNELPTELQTEAGRREWLERELARERAQAAENGPLDPERIGRFGRRGGCGKRTASSSRNAGRTRSRFRRARAVDRAAFGNTKHNREIDRFNYRGRSLVRTGLRVRQGIHIGEIEWGGNDVGGIAVNLATRVQGAAGADEVIVSRVVANVCDRESALPRSSPGRGGFLRFVRSAPLRMRRT